MRRYLFVLHRSVAIACAVLATLVAEPARGRSAEDLHRRALVVDAHAITAARLLRPELNLWTDPTSSRTSLPRLKEGGVDVAAVVVYEGPASDAFKPVSDTIARVSAEAESHGVSIVRSANDVKRANGGGKPALIFSLEGGRAVGRDLHRLKDLHAMGVRWITLAYTRANDLIASAYEDPKGRLTLLGREAVRAMNRAGLMIDVAHAPEPAIAEILEISKAPVIASHAASQTLANIVENLSDDIISKIARKNGVVMINLGSPYLTKRFADRARTVTDTVNTRYSGDMSRFYPTWREMDEAAGGPLAPASFDEMMDALEHLIKVAGPRHVGLGSDLDGVSNIPVGMETAADYPKITEALLRRGHSEKNVRGFLGENWLRVFREAEKRR